MPLKKNVIDEQSVNDNNYKELKKLFPHAMSIDENGKYIIDSQKLQLSLNPRHNFECMSLSTQIIR